MSTKCTFSHPDEEQLFDMDEIQLFDIDEIQFYDRRIQLFDMEDVADQKKLRPYSSAPQANCHSDTISKAKCAIFWEVETPFLCRNGPLFMGYVSL